ncbi:MAG: hypothetical protein ACYDDS_13505 [Candidatus Sulfotelmatobacter sp.]
MADGREAKLIGVDRNRVVWIGRQIPDELRRVTNVLGLSVDEVRNLERLDVSVEDLFAVFVSAVDDDAAKAEGRILRLITKHVLDYGVLLGAASPNPSQAFKLQSEILGKTNAQIAALGLTSDFFAGALRAHKAGEPANSKLKLKFVEPVQFYGDYESDLILLQRAFNGFTELTLKGEPGGHSSKDCKVWRVHAHSTSGPCEPFVAKASSRDDLQTEFETYCTFVRDSIPFPFRAPLLEARFVRGATRAVLVSAFVSRSQRLDEYLATASSPELVMVSLFNGALGTWRRNAESVRMSLGHFYIDQQKSNADSMAKSRLPNPKRLAAAFKKARQSNKQLPSPSQLWKQLNGLPVKKHFICRVHGDLNIRNVFVRWNTIDTILIDFSHSGIKESMARDPTKLDTSISLTARDSKGTLLSEDTLRELYQDPLLPPRNLTRIDGRIDAIRQIRQHAGGEGVSSYEYEVLTICHLLRFASEPPNNEDDTTEKQERRALSYTLACGLL